MKQVFVIGSSSKIAKNLEAFLDESEYEKTFFGRKNPNNLKDFRQYDGIFDQESVKALIKILEEAVAKRKDGADELHLVILAGVSSRDWLESFYVNEYLPAALSEKFAELAEGLSKPASITLIGSAAAYMGAKIQYATTKASLTGILHTINRDFAKKVRINLIVPSAFESGMTDDWSEEKKKAIGESNSIGRLGYSSEIADAIKFAIDNKFLTGAMINMTGGLVNIE
ncbi:MAG: SDR family oxidoreductase [Candidatus Saccharibacteria bacterium]|nr:SDR family oxidoreductase [Candidatus Saccharibacteria bacterium]